MEELNDKQFKVTEDLLATQYKRFSNYVIDNVMRLLLSFIILTAVGLIAERNGNKVVVNYIVKMGFIQDLTLSIGILLIYYNILEILFARTVGKFMTNTMVVDENGEKPNHQAILMRSLCRLIPFEAFSFLSIPPRGWHDSLSKTYVVDIDALEEKKRLFYSPETEKEE